MSTFDKLNELCDTNCPLQDSMSDTSKASNDSIQTFHSNDMSIINDMFDIDYPEIKQDKIYIIGFAEYLLTKFSVSNYFQFIKTLFKHSYKLTNEQKQSLLKDLHIEPIYREKIIYKEKIVYKESKPKLNMSKYDDY